MIVFGGFCHVKTSVISSWKLTAGPNLDTKRVKFFGVVVSRFNGGAASLAAFCIAAEFTAVLAINS